MLTSAYCRASTEEQAAEGFLIDGQAEKLRVYAELNDLGEVLVVTDPGRSGKDLDRPGLQQVLAMVEREHAGHVLVWRLDRLSRNLGDLIGLADLFGQRGVALHSFTERLDLSTATGRMFYNILGSFAQFYREQLSENVRLGMQQAARQGRWINRPKTGYNLVGGQLVPNDDAPRVREVFRLRAQGRALQAIEDRTGIKYSTARLILDSRIYLGEVLHVGDWYPGTHEPLITAEEFAAAHVGFVPGRRRLSREVLSGRVRCGLCGKLAAVEYTQSGVPKFRCKHRGKGCAMPRRAAEMLERAFLIGLGLVGHDRELRAAIRRELERSRSADARQGDANGTVEPRRSPSTDLERKRRKLLELYYADKISPDLFAEEERRLAEAASISAAENERTARASAKAAEVSDRFAEVAETLASLDAATVWAAATRDEQRVLVHELLEELALFPDHLEVSLAGVPRLNVTLEEVGVQLVGVRGGT